MEKINTYEIHMKLNGRMTQLPDSQKIFGTLVYLYAENYSKEDTTTMVDSVKNREWHCALSNMFPKGYFPAPTTYLLEWFSDQADMKENKKRIYQKIKEKEFIKREVFEDIINNPKNILQCHYAHSRKEQQIHAAIDSLQYQLSGLSPDLYSVQEEMILEDDNPITEFYFYLSIGQGGLERRLLDALQDAKNQQKPFFMGPRASQGLNLFRIQDISSVEIVEDNAEYYLNLGMFLPDNIDFNRSYMNYFTSERRPYHRMEGWNKNQVKKCISYITAGSILYLMRDKTTASKCVMTGYDNHSIIHGNGMLYPIFNLNGGI